MTDQERIEENREIMKDNLGVIYHIMYKVGMHKHEIDSDLGQYIWMKLYEYLPSYRKEKGKIGTWAYWNILAARKQYEYQQRRYKHHFVELDAHRSAKTNDDEEYNGDWLSYEEHKPDFLAIQYIEDVMAKAIADDTPRFSHKEVAKLYWGYDYSCRSIARMYKVSKQRIQQSLTKSKENVMRVLPLKFKKEMVHGY